MPDLERLRRDTAEDWLARLPGLLALTDEAVADAVRRGAQGEAEQLLDDRWTYVELGQMAREVLGQR